MAKIDFYKIDKSEKAAIFNEIATQLGMKPFAVEKDWWVSRTLEIIFQMPIAEHLVFKPRLRIGLCYERKKDKEYGIARNFFTGSVAFATLRIKN
jgi:hypothetical protein